MILYILFVNNNSSSMNELASLINLPRRVALLMHLDSSIRLFDCAKKLMPGGVSSPVRAISPCPFYTARADGPYLWDADGNRFIDYCLAYGPMILGHRHPAIVRAVTDQMSRGWLYGTPSELEVAAAQRITRLYPSMEMAQVRQLRHGGHHGCHSRGARRYGPG